jgi:hypothetical protein
MTLATRAETGDAAPQAVRTPPAPPFRPIPEHDGSLLRLLFRGARFPDTERWSHGIHLHVRGRDGSARELSVMTNVQLFAEPLGGEAAPAAVLAIRDVDDGRRWIARSRGFLSSSPACRYSASNWLMMRLDPEASTFDADAIGVDLDPDSARQLYRNGCYVICIRSKELEARLFLDQMKGAALGREGWLDYNPQGRIPVWTTAKVRIASPSGHLVLRDDSGTPKRYEVVGGYAHFEQQSILPSASKVPLVTSLRDPKAAVEMLLGAFEHRVRLHRFRAALTPEIHKTARAVWNPSSGATYLEHASLLDDNGAAVELVDLDISAPRDDGPSPSPTDVTVSFRVPEGTHRMPPGRYEARFVHDPRIDWSVPLVAPLGLVCSAHEAHSIVTVTRNDTERLPATSGGQETIDLMQSISRES